MELFPHMLHESSNILQLSFTVHDFLYFAYSLNVNKSTFHLKEWSRIFINRSNKNNVTTLPFNLVSFQIRDFNIFGKVLWNWFSKIWGVIMNVVWLKYLIWLYFLNPKAIGKPSNRKNGRSMQKWPKEVLCDCDTLKVFRVRSARNERLYNSLSCWGIV